MPQINFKKKFDKLSKETDPDKIEERKNKDQTEMLCHSETQNSSQALSFSVRP
jgi:hypothetical protein